MENSDNLFMSVLRTLDEHGILQELILIGSWCHYFYRIHFNDKIEIPILRTLDIDFLIPNPFKSDHKVNMPEILGKLDFKAIYDYPSEHMKYVHPELELEFLTPELGRGKGNKPYKIPSLQTNAQGLRYLNLLQGHILSIKSDNIVVKVPEPAAYVLHKFIVCEKRKSSDKSIRDVHSAKTIGEFLLKDKIQTRKLLNIYSTLPKRWQKIILKNMKANSELLYNLIHRNVEEL